MAQEAVTLVECPRDAWQGLKRQIPTELKVRYLRALIDAGFKHLDAVSFVSPKAVPQMADSEDVLARLDIPADVEVIGIVVNVKGAERAIATGAVRTLGFPCSISETFLRRNQNQSPGENFEMLRAIKSLADNAGLQAVAYISMAFGNPYGDLWSEARVGEAAVQISELGVTALSLADTIGAAEPELIARVVAATLSANKSCDIGVHLHSTRARAAEKISAAFEGGCRRFDAALAGLGGCPFAQDHLVGNIPTEEVIRALQGRGVRLEVDGPLDALLAMSGEIGREFGD